MSDDLRYWMMLCEAKPRNVSLYHLTDSGHLASIQANGLDPNKSREPARRDRLIYLAGDENHARGYADHHGDWQGKPVLLVMNSSDLDASLLGPDDVDLPDMLSGSNRDWRSFSWFQSLRKCGQCTYSGVIPWDIIRIHS